jgi:translation initiation factor 2 subunit 1
MFLRREGFPEEGEIVFCTVTKIQYHAVTVHLDEYDKQGLIPISEVSPGRIRNIRDFVQENKKVVCKVIKVDQERHQIDVSLRRANESQKRAKADAIKQEQKAEKIIAGLAEKLKKNPEEMYRQVAGPVLKHCAWVFEAFNNLVEKNEPLEKLGVDKALAKELEAVVKDKIKPKQVSIIEKAAFKSYADNGLELMKQSFAKAMEIDPSVQVAYLGGGTYRMMFTAKEYKEAESTIAKVHESMEKFLGKKAEIQFIRQEA